VLVGVNLGYKKRILPLADCPDFFAGHANFSAGHAKNNFGHADFITGQGELFGGHTKFVLGQRKTSFRIQFINKNYYFAMINQPKK